MRGQTVYLVWVISYDYLPLSQKMFIGVYSSKDEAEELVKSLNDSNTNPVESDSYGPLRGRVFIFTEEAVK